MGMKMNNAQKFSALAFWMALAMAGLAIFNIATDAIDREIVKESLLIMWIVAIAFMVFSWYLVRKGKTKGIYGRRWGHGAWD